MRSQPREPSSKYFVDTISVLTWDESKRKLNLNNHGLDFLGCDAIWDHFTVTREDRRQDYGEERLVCFGLLEGDVVVMFYTERPRGSHVISLRKAEKHEAHYYRQVAKENLG
jgi:uncharacterized DUF497 family protein